jgi:hypothetical protein
LLLLQLWLKNTIQAPALASSGGGSVSSMSSGVLLSTIALPA